MLFRSSFPLKKEKRPKRKRMEPRFFLNLDTHSFHCVFTKPEIRKQRTVEMWLHRVHNLWQLMIKKKPKNILLLIIFFCFDSNNSPPY